MDPRERPCIKICEHEDSTGWCLGCGMTKLERKAWKRAPAYRSTIREALPARLAALAGQGHVTGPAAGRKHRN